MLLPIKRVMSWSRWFVAPSAVAMVLGCGGTASAEHGNDVGAGHTGTLTGKILDAGGPLAPGFATHAAAGWLHLVDRQTGKTMLVDVTQARPFHIALEPGSYNVFASMSRTGSQESGACASTDIAVRPHHTTTIVLYQRCSVP